MRRRIDIFLPPEPVEAFRVLLDASVNQARLSGEIRINTPTPPEHATQITDRTNPIHVTTITEEGST